MKKRIILFLDILAISVYGFDLYFAISGAFDVRKNLDKLSETPGVSGVDYLGVGVDILVFGVIAISLVGILLAAITYILSQNRPMRMMTYIAMACIFLLVMFLLICFVL